VTRKSAEQREVFRDTSASAAPRLHPAARYGNMRARSYVLAMVVAGCIVLSHSVSILWTMSLPVQWWALLSLTLIAGAAVLKIPAVPVNFSISDVFTLTAAVVFGPHAGAVVVAADSLVISAFLTRRQGLPFERILFNAAGPPVAMWLSASVYYAASGLRPLSVQPLGLDIVGPWLFVFAALYFFLNTSAIAIAIALDQRVNVFQIWRSHFQNLWLTFIGGALGASFVVFALQFGSYGVVVLTVPLLLAAILHFAYRNATGRVADQLAHLAEVNRLHLSTIEALARAVDAKDGVTHGHIRRVQSTALAMAKRLGVDDVMELRAIEAAALLHDVGKLAIPEHILNKPGRLTPAEFERMKSHARIGAEILSEVDFPYPVVPIVRHHHENWDGTGYPEGLTGDAIPIGARILSVVDCFDALTSHRPYRRALSVSETFAIIDARRGSMYDPAIVDAFHEMHEAGEVSEAESADRDTSVAPPAKATGESAAASSGDDVRLALRVGASMTRGGCTMSALADALCECPDVDTAAVYIVDEGQQQLIARHVSGRHASNLDGLTIAIGERMSGWVAAVGQPMINADAALDLFDVQVDGLQSALAIPCTGAGESRAVVAVYSDQKDVFSARHERLVNGAMAMLADRDSAAQVIDIRQDRSIGSRPRPLPASRPVPVTHRRAQAG
jgi:putative nucleotidyltransferase with HDIG domain